MRASELKISIELNKGSLQQFLSPDTSSKSLQLYRALTQKIIFPFHGRSFMLQEVESHSGSFWGFGFLKREAGSEKKKKKKPRKHQSHAARPDIIAVLDRDEQINHLSILVK